MDPQKERSWYFVGNIQEAKGVVVTEAGKNPVVFRGAFGFRVTRPEEGDLKVHLIRLNLVTDGAHSEGGDTGVIGLMLDKPEYEAEFNPRDGSVHAGFRLSLHYPLIDERMGFREAKPSECVHFIPYTEVMEGKLTTRLPRGLIREMPARFEAEGHIEATITTSYVGFVLGVEIAIVATVFVLFTPAEVLRIQPVFIGSGPCDPNATGKAFNELMSRARDMWNRCGTLRCISFAVDPPVYLNKDQFRVISSNNEGYSMRLEHSDPNAVEVFVTERMDPPEMWGGGATWGSGTASAFIVTSDQQLDVPCPPPCPGGGACGDVNYYHLAHELGHALNLSHPGDTDLAQSSAGSVMEPSGFCADNPSSQSARNCRNASNPLLTWGKSICFGSPDIMD
jgi:hypothetical protein